MTLGPGRRKRTSNTLFDYSLDEIDISTCQSGFIVETHWKVFPGQRGVRQGIRGSRDHWEGWRSEKEATTSRIVGPLPVHVGSGVLEAATAPQGQKVQEIIPKLPALCWPQSWGLWGHMESSWPLLTLTSLQVWCGRQRMSSANLSPNALQWAALNGIFLREREGNDPPLQLEDRVCNRLGMHLPISKILH